MQRLLILCCLLAAVPWSSGAAFDHTHAGLDRVLRARVRDGAVDYLGLKARPKELRDWLAAAGAVPEPEFNSWSREQQLAFLINLYNAATLQLIVDHHPVQSIKDIGGFFKGPWKQAVVPLFGGRITLDDLEHGILRPRYQEPRLHFALVCAAKGCPPLRPGAYVAGELDRQLAEQGANFLQSTEKNHFDPATGTLHLSPIFKWFRADFETGSRSLPQFVAPYFPEPVRAQILRTPSVRIRFTRYDWSLNELPIP